MSGSLELQLRRIREHARQNRADYHPNVHRFCSLFRTRKWFSLEFIAWLERRKR